MTDNKETFQFPWTLFLTIVALGASSIILYNSLSSSRPDTSAVLYPEPYSLQNIAARLWEDPFAAIDRIRGTVSETLVRRNAASQRENLFRGLNPKRCLILAIMTNGGPYADQAERRIRDRVAVCQGLARTGYMPADADHIGFLVKPYDTAAYALQRSVQPTRDFHACLAQRLPAISVKGLRLDQLLDRCPRWIFTGDLLYPPHADSRHFLAVPFERFIPNDVPGTDNFQVFAQKEAVIVLWLRNEAFSNAPLSQLATFFSWFVTDDEFTTACPIAVLGPENSTTLRGIVDEAKAPISSAVKAILANTTMYSFRASASEDSLSQDAKQGRSLRTPVSELIEAAMRRPVAIDSAIVKAFCSESRSGPIRLAFQFCRTILTDDATSRLLSSSTAAGMRAKKYKCSRRLNHRVGHLLR